jgi:protein involved in polysaccharide export with SLBB domain
MEVMKKLLLITFLVLGGSSLGQAQDFFYRKNLANIRVDNLSQDQVIRFQRQVQQSNMSEQEVANYLVSKGLSRDEINKLKKRMGSLAGGGGNGSVAGDFELLDQYFRLRDSLQLLKADSAFIPSGKNRNYLRAKEVADSVIFGSELFANSKMSFISEVQLATPDRYILGPRDVITMTLFGAQESSLELKVQPDGKVNVPYAGVMPLAGLTIEQATDKMKQALIRNGYATLATGETELNLTIAEFRTFPVTVIGARNSGNYVVPSIATVFHVLHLAGGPNKRGTYREIEVIRKGKVVQRIDLYRFLAAGDNSQNINLKENDVINIPIYANRVMVKGEVKRPGLFELLPGENFERLLAYAGGFTDAAFKERVYVEQIGENEFTTRDIEAAAYPSYTPSSGDVLIVGSILNRFSNRIAIGGAIKRPGYYGWETDMPLSVLIEKAGGLQENALLTRGLIYRAKKDNSKTYLQFIPQEVLDGKTALTLEDGDSILIGDKSVLFPEEYVRVMGQVRLEGEFIFGSGMTAMDAILMAGGFKRNAMPKRIEIARRINATTDFEIAKLIHAQTDFELVVKAEDEILEAGDIVLVRPNPSYQEQRVVMLEGEFNYPGPYVLLKQRESIGALLKRAGGLTSMADQRFAYVVRERKQNQLNERKINTLPQKTEDLNKEELGVAEPDLTPTDAVRLDTIVIDLALVLRRKGSRYDLDLQKGDKVVVPLMHNMVSVNGEVNSKVTMNYNGKSVRSYLSDAGGLTPQADKKRIYVVHANGMAAQTHTFLGIKNYPKIKPGSVVVVPMKEQVEHKRDPANLAAASSIIASTTSLLFILITTMR